MNPGTRVRVLVGEDAGRVGVVVAPEPIAPGIEPVLAMLPLDAVATIYGKQGHVIVIVDAEAGQGLRGGRGGKRMCLLPEQLELESTP